MTRKTRRSGVTAAATAAILATTGIAGAARTGPPPKHDPPSLPAALAALPDQESAGPPAASFLALLPEGERRRRFQLECTGCHVFDAFPVAGVPPGESAAVVEARTEAEWRTAIERMRATFGPGSGFPILSGAVDPRELAAWLAESLPRRPAPTPPTYDPGSLAEGVEVTEFPVPVPQDLPHDVAVAPDGSVVVTGMFTHRMYVLDPTTGDFTTEDIPVPQANPRAVEIDDQGRWYALLGGPEMIARFDPEAAAPESTPPAPAHAEGPWESWSVDMYGHSVALDASGGVWTNGHFSHAPERIVRLDPETGERTFYEVPREEGGGALPDESTIPYGLRIGPDGTVWGTQLRGNRLVRLDPETGAVDQWELPVSHAGPRRLDVAPDGTVWVPLYGADALARFDPDTEAFRVWAFPVEGALPYVVRLDTRRDRVWIGTGQGDVAAWFDPGEERFHLVPLPTRGALVRHIDVDERTGEVWAAYGASPGIPGAVARIRVEG